MTKSPTHRRTRTLAGLLAAASLLSACAVGPDFARPQTAVGTAYTPAPPPAVLAADGAAQRLAPGADLPAQWWSLFRSAKLDALVREALAANPSIPAAAAALRAARENVRAQQGQFFPQLGAALDLSRQRVAGPVASGLANNANLYSLHTAQVTVGFAPDLFGGNRRAVESLRAQADYQRFELEAAQLSVTSNVVATVVEIAALRDQADATRQSIAALEGQLGIFRKQLELGAIPGANVVAQEGLLAQTRAQLPVIERQLAQANDALAALLGKRPDEVAALDIRLSDLTLPDPVPLSLPSQLTEHRPDVRAAEAQMHAALAQVGVATANLLPQITLTAGGGTAATSIAGLFGAGTGFWGLTGGLLQPLFQGGTLRARKRAAEAEFDETAALYRSTVLGAFQNVADTLHALRYDAEQLDAAAAGERSATQLLGITRRQVELGDTSYLALLTAQQNVQTARLAAIQARGARLADTAALFQALGGGWWQQAAANSAPPPAPAG